MKRVLGCLLLAAAAFAAETPQEMFEKGLVKERSEGNLKEAIQLYERAAETAGKNRARWRPRRCWKPANVTARWATRSRGSCSSGS